jgi:hypothetical protein
MNACRFSFVVVRLHISPLMSRTEGVSNVEKTKINAKFIVWGPEFDVNEVSKELIISPAGFYRKGEHASTAKNNVRNETSWWIETGFEESFDTSEQLSKLYEVLLPKVGTLQAVKEKHALKYKFMVVIHIEENSSPAIILTNELIAFMHQIDADIEMDQYIYS